MNLKILKKDMDKLISKHPDKEEELKDIYQLAVDEIESGGSVSHECELAISDMNDVVNESMNESRGGNPLTKFSGQTLNALSKYKVYFDDNYIELIDGRKTVDQFPYPGEGETVSGDSGKYELYFNDRYDISYLEFIQNGMIVTTLDFELDENTSGGSLKYVKLFEEFITEGMTEKEFYSRVRRIGNYKRKPKYVEQLPSTPIKDFPSEAIEFIKTLDVQKLRVDFLDHLEVDPINQFSLIYYTKEDVYILVDNQGYDYVRYATILDGFKKII